MENGLSCEEEIVTVTDVCGHAMSVRTILDAAQALGLADQRRVSDYREACQNLVENGDLLITPVFDPPRRPWLGNENSDRRLILAPHHIENRRAGDVTRTLPFKAFPLAMMKGVEEAWKHPAAARGADRKLATHHAGQVLKSLHLFRKRRELG